MKHVFITAITTFLLTGCASGPSAYGPKVNGLGFNQTQIENDRFRVSYTGRSAQEAQDYALLRAAEITLDHGYSHFKIIGEGLSDNGPARSGISTSLGIGIGSGGRGYYGGGRTRTNVGVGINVNDVARALQGNQVNSDIEIRLLRRAGAQQDNIYDAKSITDSIRPQLFQ